MNRILSNYLFNAIYQLLVVLLPFITTPYVARVLGPEKLGANAYTFSIIQILMVIGMLGVPLYGNRQIAIYAEKGKEKITREFWSIYSIQFIGVGVCIVLYLIYVLSLSSEFWVTISLLQGLYLLSSMFDISWLLLGVQRLKQAVTRNFIFKILSIILVFIFVKDENDLDIYILIMGGTMLIGQLILWFYAKNIIFIKPQVVFQDFKKHIKPIMILFMPQILGQLYLSLDKVILQVFTTEVQVGYYDQALKISKLVLTIITSIGVVMLPNISAAFVKGDREKVVYYVEKVLLYILFITIPMVIGISAISDNFISWFLGKDFQEVSGLLKILSPIIFFIGLGSLFGMQILAGTGQEGKLTISIFSGALVSIVVSLIFVPKYGAYAAAASTLLAEATVAIIQFFFVRRFINLTKVYKSLFLYIISSIIMMLSVISIGNIEFSVILKTFVQILVGIVVYLSMLFILKEKFIMEANKIILPIIYKK